MDFDEASLWFHVATTNPKYWTDEMQTAAKRHEAKQYIPIESKEKP